MKNIFLNFMLNILKKYMTFIIIYSFFLKKMKSEKIEKIVGWLQVFQLFQFKIFHDKKYVIHIENLKLALDYGLVLKKCIELLNSIKKLG